ncbi:hypothetical protein EVAR_47425_1 [Eumeta japonica]|uniref:Uncharacterized protein n=1 Tax=Eumeta variegata TaxID=151549 RepID=A0A4C1Y0W5_EUMVA|nr:hypothetical protein EVAR_47425_1 [Eumeta japonica]
MNRMTRHAACDIQTVQYRRLLLGILSQSRPERVLSGNGADRRDVGFVEGLMSLNSKQKVENEAFWGAGGGEGVEVVGGGG